MNYPFYKDMNRLQLFALQNYHSVIECSIVIFLIISCFIRSKKINQFSRTLCAYFLFRWITNYRKCTISYYECKLRGVKKEKGILFNILNNIFDYNKSKYRILLYLVILLIFQINNINASFNY